MDICGSTSKTSKLRILIKLQGSLAPPNLDSTGPSNQRSMTPLVVSGDNLGPNNWVRNRMRRNSPCLPILLVAEPQVCQRPRNFSKAQQSKHQLQRSICKALAVESWSSW